MSNEHENDDEIRESIPCGEDGWPVGYCRTPSGLCWRGVLVRGNDGVPDYDRAWRDSIARERARRQRDGQVTASDKATAMLAEVIRERDEALAQVVELATDKGKLRYALEAERGAVIIARMERDELRERLDRVRGLDRWDMAVRSEHTGPSWDTFPGSDIGVITTVEPRGSSAGKWVSYDALHAIIGKDGE